jgi:MFS family permease
MWRWVLLSGGVKGLPMLLLVLAAIGCYAMSLAPVTWVVISEIFPNRIRGAAMSVAVCALWIACFILTYTFPMLNAKLGAAGTFWLYAAAICVAGFVFIFFQAAGNQRQNAGANRTRFGGRRQSHRPAHAETR